MTTGEPQANQSAPHVVHPPLPSALGQARGEGYSNIGPSEAHGLIEKSQYTYVDVRTPEEYATGHAPGSVNIPILVKDKEGGELQPNPGFLQQVKERFPDSEAPIVTSCQHGRRGELAAQTLADAGFANLRNLKGGFAAWVGEHLPSTSAETK